MTLVSPEDAYRALIPVSDWDAGGLSTAWHEYLALLDEARSNAQEPDLKRAVDFALRSAALETGAIEGLYATARGVTRTVALQGAMWEAALDEIGPDVRGHFAAQLEALELVLDVATQSRSVTEVWIRELHALTCREQKTYRVMTAVGPQDHELHHGAYKTQPNHVTRPDGQLHHYCPVDDVPAEMHRLIEQLQSPEFVALHAVAQAAYSHHAFASIHPFSDGNGRVARALASVFLFRSIGVPLVVFSDQQERYWDALHAADLGQHAAFVGFIEDRAIDTMAMIGDRLREGSRPLTDQAEALHSLFTAHGGLTYAEVEAAGQRLVNAVQVFMSEVAGESGLSPDIQRMIEPRGGKLQCDFGRPYHTLQGGGAFAFRLSCAEPITTGAETTPFVGVADSVDERLAYIVIDANRPQSAPLRVRTDDLHPAITASAEARIRSWVAGAFGAALADLHRGIAQGLHQQGFAPS